MRIAWIAFLLTIVGLSTGCRSDEKPLVSKNRTFAELRTIKRGVAVTPPDEETRSPYGRERLVDGEKLELTAGALAWLRRDGGATLLIAGPAKLTLRADKLDVDEGKIFVDTPPGGTTELSTPRGDLHLSAVRTSLELDKDGKLSAYVLRGGVRTDSIQADAGERLTIAPDGKATKEPVLSWTDWTGGLATMDRAPEPAPFGIGTVGARKPGEQGTPRFPLSIQRMDVRVTIEEDFAVTEVEQVFANPTGDTVEGLYGFRTPEGAALHRFGVDRDGEIVWGRVKEKHAAAAQYQAHVYEGSREDPALLEWDAPGVYKARLYPIHPRETRRIVTRYAEWLGRQGPRGERRLYLYPMAAEGAEGTLPRIEELTITLDLEKAKAKDVRVGLEGKRVGNTVTVKAHDFVPRADFAVELYDDGQSQLTAYRAEHTVDRETTAADQLEKAELAAREEDAYLLIPVRPTRANEPEGGLDLALIVDTSAATDPGALAIARSTTGALLAHLGPSDRAAVWAGDATLRPVAPGSDHFEAMDTARREAVATGLAQIERGGATDLGAIVAEAASRLDAKRRSAVVYIGDGQPTVGERAVLKLRERLGRLPRPTRLFAVGVGDRANLELLDGISRGGFAVRVGDAYSAGLTALRVLEEAERPVWLGAKVDLGPGIDRVFPRELGALVADESRLVVGRIAGPVPKQVRIQGSGGEVTKSVRMRRLADGGDLRRRWAEGRLRQLLDDGSGRAAVVEVGVRSGIITPFTSLYVPTAAEHAAELNRAEDGDAVAEGPRWWEWFFPDVRSKSQAFSDYAPVAAAEAVEEEYDDAKEGGTGTRAKGEEGSMGTRAPQKQKRYAVRGPRGGSADAPADESAPEEAKPRAEVDALDFGMIGQLEAAEPEAERVMPSKAPMAKQARRPRPSAARRQVAPGAPMPDQEVADPLAFDEPAAPPPPSTAEEKAAAANAWGGDIGEAYGSGGLGLTGVGAGGGGKGDTSRDGRLATGQGFGSGHGRLGGKDRKDKQPASAPPLATSRSAQALGSVGHTPRPCSPAADLPFEERRQLWSERLARSGGNVGYVAGVYSNALRDCEAPTWRERSQLLILAVEILVHIGPRVQLWRHFRQNRAAADVIYRALLTRVHTAEQIRELHAVLGIRHMDRTVLAKVMKERKTPAERAKLLHGLVEQWPDDLELALELLYALEDAGDDGAGRALARRLRRRSDATTRLRTAVGEYYLRLGKRSKATSQADLTEARRTFGEIVEFAPDDPHARRLLGDLLRAHGWYQEAQRQYETLATLVPDDPSVPLLLAVAADGMGRTEEAVKWTEKAATVASPDPTSPLAKTARSFAAAFLAWARADATKAGRKKEAERLRERARRLTAIDPAEEGAVRLVLTWAHPELRPELWSNALGSLMPAGDGDPALGLAQTVLPASRAAEGVEIHLAPEDAERAARLGATATLTAIVDEGTQDEKIARLSVRFTRTKAGPKEKHRFVFEDGALREETL